FMENTQKSPNLEQIFGEAEERFRKGLNLLADWSEQARNVIQERPGVLTASIAIAGFMAGLITRKGGVEFAQRGKSRETAPEFFADPIVVFIAGTIAGFAFGPQLMQSAVAGNYPRATRSAPSLERH
ncbi:MAG: hypothetical protein NDJ90_12425, partial [Oligoflexia bacterium]|nr:hypothetical protein [Oligoflexia bacterium]